MVSPVLDLFVMSPPFDFDNSFARLPERFHARMHPTSVPEPRLIRFNRALAHQLGLDAERLDSAEGAAILTGNRVPEGAEPLAMAYAGHQFGGWVPSLGDGRALLLGEVLDREGRRFDLHLKGTGRTPFSRGGDGRSPLGPVLREYVVSEAMFALGIPTTRALAATTTGEPVFRERPLAGAVLTRVARSHLRVGTFEYHAARGDREAVRILADHTIARHFPDLAEDEGPYRALLKKVVELQAELISRWMAVGFIHGVMNTDNMLVSGETIDYGPCAFLDHYDPRAVFSSIDRGGRYAFGSQPGIAHWNLARLAEALLPLLDDDQERAVATAEDALQVFPDRFEVAFAREFGAKLGLASVENGDSLLLNDLLGVMARHRCDFTLTFRRLAELADPGRQGYRETEIEASVADLVTLPEELDSWLVRWRERLGREDVDPAERRASMSQASPAVIPRNHQIERVIEAGYAGDFSPFEALVEVLGQPFDYDESRAEWAVPPGPEEVVTATFCGT